MGLTYKQWRIIQIMPAPDGLMAWPDNDGPGLPIVCLALAVEGMYNTDGPRRLLSEESLPHVLGMMADSVGNIWIEDDVGLGFVRPPDA
jgi:hypothetical protein